MPLQPLKPVKCDGDHAWPPCKDDYCWHRSPPGRLSILFYDNGTIRVQGVAFSVDILRSILDYPQPGLYSFKRENDHIVLTTYKDLASCAKYFGQTNKEPMIDA